MARLRKRGEEIREFILENIANNTKDIATATCSKFNITRQAVNKHMRHLQDQGSIIRKGSTRNIQYELHPQEQWEKVIQLADRPSEDVVWRNEIRQRLGKLPDNALAIWQHGFTEMFNNAIDHSEGTFIGIDIKKTAYSTEIIVWDNGVGIFTKIKNALQLIDERHAVLELTKGKLTTDPDRHTGEGIFFSSRMFDQYSILSGEVYLSHRYDKEEDWILQNHEYQAGTYIFMTLHNNTSRTTKEVFDKFTSAEDDYGFTKTVVPVRLAQYGNEQLISRSQAKRLLARVDRFKTVLFDFSEVQTIGQAFADEVFRVFVKQYPEIKVVPINDNEAVNQMIKRAQSGTYTDIITPDKTTLR
jgi:anti-sigma regulatory factor (Ser/Thr protein kinase)